jgi:hypothetical protein
MTTQQLQRAISALGMAWQHETGTPFDAMGFLGTVTLRAFANGFPDSAAFQDALILCAYELGKATQGEAFYGRKALTTARNFCQLAQAALAI